MTGSQNHKYIFRQLVMKPGHPGRYKFSNMLIITAQGDIGMVAKYQNTIGYLFIREMPGGL
jgi:hypothetical protein